MTNLIYLGKPQKRSIDDLDQRLAQLEKSWRNLNSTNKQVIIPSLKYPEKPKDFEQLAEQDEIKSIMFTVLVLGCIFALIIFTVKKMSK